MFKEFDCFSRNFVLFDVTSLILYYEWCKHDAYVSYDVEMPLYMITYLYLNKSSKNIRFL